MTEERDVAALVSRIAGVDEGRFRSRTLGLFCYLLPFLLFGWISFNWIRQTDDVSKTEPPGIERDRRVDELDQGFQFALEFIVLPLGGVCIYLGKRLRAKSALAVLQKDRRPPILYLRSFKFDGLAVVGHLKLMSRTEEEDLVHCFKRIGPVIAIGDPSEKIPEVGAARVYVNHDQWQQCALDMMQASRLIVLRAGLTEGIFWEIDRVRSHIQPEKVLLFVPFISDRKLYAEFCHGVGQPLESKLAPLKGSRFVIFDKHWNPQSIGEPSSRIGRELEGYIKGLQAA